MCKSYVLSNVVVKAFAFLAMAILSNAVFAENYAQLVVNGPEKIKVNKCGSSSVNYVYSIRLRENGSWDLYDEGQGAYTLDSGTYTGSLTSRKMTATASVPTANKFIDIFEQYAEGACRSSSVDIDYAPFIYKIKVNKNKTNASLQAKINLKGFDNQNLVKKKGQYKYSGKGVYSIKSFDS
jgi:hypothetical protein